MDVSEYVTTIRRGGEAAEEAALTLGLLIERETTNRPEGDDGGVRQVLGDDIANQRLTEAEIDTAVTELIRYVVDTPAPHATAVWALGKSYDDRIVRPLIDLLKRTLADPSQEHLASNALSGVINTGLSSELREESLAVIREAAERGHGQVRTAAAGYLRAAS